ncbi:hypothetical protein AUTU_08350 [Aureibacter tunicatorum]|nr:hypothetical protein AUTU_08350 [Aureibacter tunicatorum]
MVAENGDFRDTAINSDRQLWSVAGNLAMIYRVFYGMNLESDKLSFAPVVPEQYQGNKILSNFKYRDAVLDITLNGFGNQINSFKVNGKEQSQHFVNSNIKGRHKIEITLNSQIKDQGKINAKANHFTLKTPRVSLNKNSIIIENYNPSANYQLIANGEVIDKSIESKFTINLPKIYTEYQVAALDSLGYQSFLSKPLIYIPQGHEQILQIEKFAKLSTLPYEGYNGKGFIELTKTKNTDVKIPVTINKDGLYAISFRYSNGSGPYNTDNKCAIRSLIVDNNNEGAIIMSQLGKDEWSSWSESNSQQVRLKKGKHLLQLKFLPHNENMNVDVNRALVDQVKITKLD